MTSSGTASKNNPKQKQSQKSKAEKDRVRILRLTRQKEILKVDFRETLTKLHRARMRNTELSEKVELLEAKLDNVVNDNIELRAQLVKQNNSIALVEGIEL